MISERTEQDLGKIISFYAVKVEEDLFLEYVLRDISSLIGAINDYYEKKYNSRRQKE
jgi:hypothetical protein